MKYVTQTSHRPFVSDIMPTANLISFLWKLNIIVDFAASDNATTIHVWHR